MLGWEFPPYFAGGVGTVCYELTRGLAKRGVEITYLMPHGPSDLARTHVRLLAADKEVELRGITELRVRSLLSPYASREGYARAHGALLRGEATPGGLYGADLLGEMRRFADAAQEIARREQFDIIHAHDWTTIPAALAIKAASGKPLILHVHITEFDKTGGEHADPEVYALEHEGFHRADALIAVSNYVKQRLVERYYVPPEKIRVIHNAVDGSPQRELGSARERIGPGERIVLFLGRVTLQKGPDYFLEAAAKVAPLMPDVRFIVAGTGDMLARMIERAAALGIANRVIFTGFVSREEAERLYAMADLFVMPSVSEPFGIVPLEAMRHGTPVIISKQSGVSEVVRHALKVDFWDVDGLASKIVAALSYSAMHHVLREHTFAEIGSFTWETPATQCQHLYDEVLAW